MIAPLPDNPKKLVYFGTPEMAVLPLIHLVEAGFEILMVVTGEDKRRNRNSSPSHSPVKAKALELGITIINEKDFLTLLSLEEEYYS